MNSYTDKLKMIKLGLIPIEKKEKRKNDRRLFIRKVEKIENNTPTKYQLNKWFLDRRKEMTGICLECGKKSLKDNDELYKRSVAHVIPKSPTEGCPSVSCHEFNWLELCWLCHQEYDNTWEKAKKMKIWELAKNKFKTFCHLIKEKKKLLVNFID